VRALGTILALLALLGAQTVQAAVAESTTLVLVVASNRGPALDRPPLQYADDDGAKYHAVLASLAGEENSVLLTELDADSARLFPHLAGKVEAPTRGNVVAASERLARRAREVQRAGGHVGFYFVFAGHGDVDGGRGFLELADSAFTAEDVEGLLRTVGADEAHVILDSCNSFFVINPRKPGGRRFATPKDAAEKLAKQLPNVGVFLSTSAESEVFEWSELQSGVFSHAVRSGLMGAADANRDGRVSYEELAAFVETAAAEIKNPAYRPKVFARGPNGDDERTLFDLSRTRGLAVRIDDAGALRLAARDSDGLRWLDAHKEEGQSLELHLPAVLAGRLDMERLSSAGAVEARYPVPASTSNPVVLASLSPEPAPSAVARGGREIFRGLFVRPFGPRALAAYQEEHRRAPEPVYGLSREDTSRMGLLLEQLSASARHDRRTMGGINLAMAGIYGTYFGLAEGTSGLKRDERIGVLIGGALLTGVNLGAGLFRLLRTSEREQVFEDFRAQMAEPDADQARIAAAIEQRLVQIQTEERRRRKEVLIAGYIATGLFAGCVALNEVSSEASREYRLVERGFILGVGAMILGLTLKEQLSTSPTDKLIELWHKDPRRIRVEVSAAPVQGGGVVGMTGKF
jgi:hypothetical protein